MEKSHDTYKVLRLTTTLNDKNEDYYMRDLYFSKEEKVSNTFFQYHSKSVKKISKKTMMNNSTNMSYRKNMNSNVKYNHRRILDIDSKDFKKRDQCKNLFLNFDTYIPFTFNNMNHEHHLLKEKNRNGESNINNSNSLNFLNQDHINHNYKVDVDKNIIHNSNNKESNFNNEFSNYISNNGNNQIVNNKGQNLSYNNINNTNNANANNNTINANNVKITNSITTSNNGKTENKQNQSSDLDVKQNSNLIRKLDYCLLSKKPIPKVFQTLLINDNYAKINKIDINKVNKDKFKFKSDL